MELYHNNMSVCAQKVRLVVREKGLKPIEHQMMLRNGDVHTPEYLKLNPKGVVPTLIDHGEVIIESTIICEYLEEAYPQNPLRPDDPILRARMRQWTQLPDSSLHNATGIVSVALAWRHQMLAAGNKQFENRPDKGGQGGTTRVLLEVVDKGIESEHFAAAIRTYDYAIERMAKALEKSTWLVGEAYSLADIAMLPYVCRLEDLSLSWMWDGERARVADWLLRAKARPNFSGIKDYLVPSYVSLCAEHGSAATPRLKEMLNSGPRFQDKGSSCTLP